MLFSERTNYKSVKSLVQKESIDSDLMYGLWNAVSLYYFNNLDLVGSTIYISENNNEKLFRICQKIWLDLFKLPIQTLPVQWDLAIKF